ncbi:hypothetical protein TRFO_18638 [Tritrichomonas foetus]|uniref:Protein kinase domain-containing protein n=1 Tax=Tritrichomonas foetus TaxID=1144522 RepID=A0A1J4KPX0_9EUKA|nr:hypothetical protein TRFO_18638 [Tritrichomonas foetus]|eukprot:OHT11836.1 hypothetical protein TRFO_18638 [Tritrichomonas foetus]
MKIKYHIIYRFMSCSQKFYASLYLKNRNVNITVHFHKIQSNLFFRISIHLILNKSLKLMTKEITQISFSEFEKLFILVNETSRTGFSSTFLMRNRFDQSLYICKFFKKSFMKNTFIRELKKIYKADLTNQIKKFTVFTENQECYILLRPYIKMLPLHDVLENKTYDLTKMFQIWKNILIVYNSFHKSGIKPNIIKISNIFVKDSNEHDQSLNDCSIEITDIYPLPAITLSGIITPNTDSYLFLAPELITQNYKPSEKSDMWSLGALLIFCCGYKLPWATVNICAMLKKIAACDFELSNDIPKFIRDIAKMLLVLDPSKRATSDDILALYKRTILPPKFNLIVAPKRNSLPFPKPISVVISSSTKLTKNFSTNVRSTLLPPIPKKFLSKVINNEV